MSEVTTAFNSLQSQFLRSLQSTGTVAATALGGGLGAMFSQELTKSLAGGTSAPVTDATAGVAAAGTATGASTLERYMVASSATSTAANGSGTAAPEQLQQDFQAYFKMVPVGTVVPVGSGTVTRNQDGSATWQGDGKTYQFDATTPLADVAANTGLGAEWARSYGYSPVAATAGPASATPSASAALPFTNFEEFKTWESGLGSTFNADYKTPDYVSVMGLSIGGDGADAFKRFLFFKNNPSYANDYQSIHSGSLSQFPTDGSTLIKSDLSAMPTATAAYFRSNPGALRMAEGFGMDPTLYKQTLDGSLDTTAIPNVSSWLTQNKWTASGVVANDNRLSQANADFVGLSGGGAGTYKLARYNGATGNIVDVDGKQYNPATGALVA